MRNGLTRGIVSRKLRPVLITACLSVAATSVRAQSADEQAIRRLITESYLEAVPVGDSARVRQGFEQAHGHMLFVQADTLVDVPFPEYVRRVGAGGPRTPPNDGTTRRIVLVDVTGNAAVAKLETRTPTMVITDYMSLLRIGGRWQVVNKVFERAPTPR